MLGVILLVAVGLVVGAFASLVAAANRWLDLVEQAPPRPTGSRALADRAGTAVMALGLLSWVALGAAVVARGTPPVYRWMLNSGTPLDQFGGGPFTLWFGVLFGVGGAVLVAAGLWMKVEAWEPDDAYGPD